MYEMYVSGHFLCKIDGLFALTCYVPGPKVAIVIILKLSLNISVNFMEWNLMDSCEIFPTLSLTRFVNLVKISGQLTPTL